MTEAQARAALAAFDGVGGPEHWIAEQRPWREMPRGWKVPGALRGWAFRVEPGPGGVEVTAEAARGEPARWFVPVMQAG